MYNPSYPPGPCYSKSCFNQAYTCTYAPPDLTSIYLSTLNYVEPFLCHNGATNPTVSFLAKVADGTQAGYFMNAFDNSASGAQNALKMVKKYMPGAPCGSFYFADASACGSYSFYWNWTNLPQGIQSCAPPSPSPPPPPPPVVPTSCTVIVRMYNPANTFCPDPSKCFNSATCVNAPPDLNNFYLSGLSYVYNFSCTYGVTNPTIYFSAVMSSAADAVSFITGFGSGNVNGANYASVLVNTFMPGVPCDATYVADAGQCNSGFFQWDKSNLPALSCARPPSPPPPPPPVIPTSCNVYVRLYNSKNTYCPDPSKCFNANTCASAPANLNNFYLPGVSYSSPFTCFHGATNPTISFLAVLSSGMEAIKFLSGFSSNSTGLSYATYMVSAYMPSAPCDSTYVADASQCGAGFFQWDKTNLPALACSAPLPSPPPPPPLVPCTILVQMFNPLNSNCGDPRSSCFNSTTCALMPSQLNAFYFAGVSIVSQFSCPTYGATNPIVTMVAQVASAADGAKFIANFGSTPTGAYHASIMVGYWMPNTPCTATYSADATNCGAGSFGWSQFNLPAIPSCSANSPPPPIPSSFPSPPPSPPPLPPGSTGFDKLFFTQVKAPSAITCQQVVEAMIAYLILSGNPYVGPSCAAVSPTELAIHTYFATTQAGDMYMVTLQTYSVDFIALTELPCGSSISFFWAGTTNIFSCSFFYPSLCCYNSPPRPPPAPLPAPVGGSPPGRPILSPPPPPSPVTLNLPRDVAVFTPKTTAAGMAISALYVVNFLCPPLLTAVKGMFNDMGLKQFQNWEVASTCAITDVAGLATWRYAFAFKVDQFTSELMEAYMNNDGTLNVLVQRGNIFCSSQIRLINGTSSTALLIKNSSSYPLDPNSYKSSCIREVTGPTKG